MFLEVIRLLIMKARIEGHEMAVAQAVKKPTLFQGKKSRAEMLKWGAHSSPGFDTLSLSNHA